jgi:hypothetical protein
MLQRFETRSSDPRPNNHLIAVPTTCQSAISHNWSGWQRSRREEVCEWRERELAHVFVGPSAELQCRPCWNLWFQQDGKRPELFFSAQVYRAEIILPCQGGPEKFGKWEPPNRRRSAKGSRRVLSKYCFRAPAIPPVSSPECSSSSDAISDINFWPAWRISPLAVWPEAAQRQT